MFCANPAPRQARPNIGIEMRYTGRRPNISETGEPIIGSQASPIMYRVKPSQATSALTSKRVATAADEGG